VIDQKALGGAEPVPPPNRRKIQFVLGKPASEYCFPPLGGERELSQRASYSPAARCATPSLVAASYKREGFGRSAASRATKRGPKSDVFGSRRKQRALIALLAGTRMA